jgi:DNA-entry nuclease
MEAYSVEDNGEGICYNVFCYNVQPGVVIDYATGKSHAEGDDGNSEGDNSAEKVVSDYVLNKSSKKIHAPDCSSVGKMSEKNREYFNGTLEELFNMGYVACGSCNAGQ